VLTIRPFYLILAVFLFATEVAIATFFSDNFIRPVLGDFLVVILLYAALYAFLQVNRLKLTLGVLGFSYLIEVAQYFKLLAHLHLQHNYGAKLILGTTFSWSDMVAYTLGIAAVVCVESIRRKTLE
jgi:hypothetical protein